MQFKAATILLATLSASAIQPALAADVVETTVNIMGTKNPDGTITIDSSLDTRDLDKRGATLVVLGIAGTAAMSKVVQMGIEFGAETISNLGDWTRVREEFTKSVTSQMWAKNPNYGSWPAVACYNKGYRLRNPAGVDGKASVKVELGVLNTDYDCMYMSGNNAFYTDSEGGYINLAYKYDGSRCSFDQSTGDLTCR